jgi:hypothetical protein
MKPIKIILALCIIGSLTITSQAQSVITNGLIAFYPFNGNANDSSGNGNNGGAINGVSYVSSFLGSAALFNGNSQYIVLPNSISNYEDLSVTFWIKTGDFTSNTFPNGEFLVSRDISGYAPDWNICLEQGRKIDFVTDADELITTQDLDSNNWVQVACVADSANQSKTLFVNGQKVVSTNWLPYAFANNTVPIFIGASSIDTGSHAFFTGEMANVRIYNRALSSNDVAQLYAYEKLPFMLSSSPSVGSGPFAVTVADINGDGKMDLISANFGGQTLTVLTNNGHGGFGFNATLTVDSSPASVVAADVNGDGRMDLISANRDGNSLTVLTNNGNGGFVYSATYSAGYPYSVAAADMNGDGKIDLVSANSSDNTLTVFTNDGSGAFALAATIGTGSTPVSVVAADVNGDGKMDLVSASFYDQTVSVLTNNGHGGYALAGSPAVGNTARWVVAADVNGDSKVDLICANYGDNTLSVLTNNGTGGFILAATLPVGKNPSSVAAADFNGDGNVDLVSANYGDNTLSLLANNGNGGFVLAATLAVGSAPDFVAAADVNGDGKVDLVSANYGDNTLTVLTNSTPFSAINVPPHTATGAATLAGAFVVGVYITDSGGGYTNTPLVRIIGGGGSGAQAVAVVNNGVVTAINVINAGISYTGVPEIVVEPPFIPNPVLGIAQVSSLSFSNLMVGSNYQLQQYQAPYWMNQAGSFNATNATITQMVPSVANSDDYRLVLTPVPTQAFATPQVVNGFVVGATVTAGGSGYITPPTVNIIASAGTNAAATASVNGGTVTGITIINPGSGYTNSITMQIDPPPVAGLSPTVLPMMRVDSSNLAPYDNYQVQFKPDITGTWGNWNGGLFSPTGTTNSQFIVITNGTGYFRLQYLP